MLYPFEINELVLEAIAKCPVEGMSTKFLDTLKLFFDKLSKDIVRVRKELGMNDFL
jgi:hypothetical protein